MFFSIDAINYGQFEEQMRLEICSKFSVLTIVTLGIQNILEITLL